MSNTEAVDVSGDGQSPERLDASGHGRAPGRLDTYAMTYSFGMVWLLMAAVMLGAQKMFAFDGVYDSLLILPPLATAICLLITDRRGSWRSLPWRIAVLALVCSIASVLSTVALAPLLVVMFREGVTGDLDLTGTIASVVLLIVASPVVIGSVRAVRAAEFGRAAVLVIGAIATAIALAMALDPTGPLASSMRLDQARIVMVVSSWWLPFYAGAAALARHAGMA